MAEDLAAKLAHAFVLAAGRIADRSPSAFGGNAVRDRLADDLRDILPLSDIWFARGFREAAAGEGGGHGLIDIADAAAYAEGFHAGQRERAEVVLERASGIARAVMHAMTEYRTGQTIMRVEFDMRDAIADALAYRGEDVPEQADDPAPARAGEEPGCCDECSALGYAPGYSAPDWTPDERHRHTIGGQTWEHAHEGGHEAHSAVSHDLSGAEEVPRPPANAPFRPDPADLRLISETLLRMRVHGASPELAAEFVALELIGAGRLPNGPAPTTEEARPEPPGAVSEALDAAREYRRVVDRDALNRIAAMLREGLDLDGSDAGDSVAEIVASTGRDVAPDDAMEFCECPSQRHEDGCEYAPDGAR